MVVSGTWIEGTYQIEGLCKVTPTYGFIWYTSTLGSWNSRENLLRHIPESTGAMVISHFASRSLLAALNGLETAVVTSYQAPEGRQIMGRDSKNLQISP